MITDLIALERPLISIDVETTGLFPGIDRIVQIGLIKAYPDGKVTEFETLVNPTIPIPAEVSAIHHITDEMVKDEPEFADLAHMLARGMEECDILGYNHKAFDIKFFQAEFDLCGVPFKPGSLIDAYKIYTKFHPRNLTNASRQYLKEEHPDAHSALADARKTFQIFRAQLLEHSELPRSIPGVEAFLAPKQQGEQKFVFRNGRHIFLFGRYSGKAIEDADQSYLRWILKDKNFSEETKKIVRDHLNGA